MPCSIPGMCSKQADCEDNVCPGKAQAIEYLNLHRVWHEEQCTEETSIGPLVLYAVAIGLALLAAVSPFMFGVGE